MKSSETTNEWFETEFKWYKDVQKNLCSYCKGECRIKYIATGHDHTDYHYWLCTCPAARLGKPENDCN